MHQKIYLPKHRKQHFRLVRNYLGYLVIELFMKFFHNKPPLDIFAEKDFTYCFSRYIFVCASTLLIYLLVLVHLCFVPQIKVKMLMLNVTFQWLQNYFGWNLNICFAVSAKYFELPKIRSIASKLCSHFSWQKQNFSSWGSSK